MNSPARFEPCAENHSIAQVLFNLVLDAPVEAEWLEEILTHEHFRSNGVCSHAFRHLGITMGIGSYPPGLQPVTLSNSPYTVGLQLCDAMPMEKALRTLFIAHNQITFMCRHYERWSTTSPQVFENIGVVLCLCKERHIVAASLNYQDKFFASNNAEGGFIANDMFREDAAILPLHRALDEKDWYNQNIFLNSDIVVNIAIQRSVLQNENCEITVTTQCEKKLTESVRAIGANLTKIYNPLHDTHMVMLRKIFSDALLQHIGVHANEKEHV